MKSQIFQEAQNALIQGNFSEALQKAQQLISMDTGDHHSYLLLGDVFKGMDNATKAIENYEKALVLRPDCAEAFFKLGNAYEMKEDFLSARHQYQTARRLDPSNQLYIGYLGRLLHQKGVEDGNINYENEGLSLMEQAYTSGETDENIKEQIAIAHLGKTLSTWRKHPEQEGYFVPTELSHLDHSKAQIQKVKSLYDPSNQAITTRIAEIENHIVEAEKRQFAGYPYLRKVPFIVGAIVLIFGNSILGAIILLMGVLYHVSQNQPGYMLNRQMYKGEYRPPFIVRRLNQMDELMSSITIWDTSLSSLFFTRFLINLVGGFFRFGMVLMVLPYEIIKGFMVNYGLGDQLKEKMKSQEMQLKI